MKEVKLKKKLFGAFIEIILYDFSKKEADTILKKTYKEALRLEKIFNIYDTSSELSILNKSKKKKVSPELLFVLKKALTLCKLTNGKYDVSQGEEFLARKKGLKISQKKCSYKDIKITKDVVTINNSEAKIDLGSIAKGYITDKIKEFLIKQGAKSGIINSRGDIALFGNSTTNVKIRHPRNPKKVIGSINLRNTSVATSGDYTQYNKSFENSHIINQNKFISVTVIAKTLIEADLYATVFMICSDSLRKEILKNKKGLKFLGIKSDLTIIKV
ncbi:FAD:protein FMN transferase [archaeon]|jgi:FAD:protein FMN transferase|nr:FAD:protein FMN transferase [archaeon]MBT6182338.1 FAD:protein FMN transferase [archaeon]MBT6606684.1 FAD:protein FMN transferase [archaeon]MBT7251927.1 FAD:protein FMN transferase [archaeon]MBT7660606.1 FAD:protein FMN transferase [archaeon]